MLPTSKVRTSVQRLNNAEPGRIFEHLTEQFIAWESAMERVNQIGSEDYDPVLESIVLEGRCDCCEEVLGFFEQMIGRTRCSACRKEAQPQRKGFPNMA
jgi:hypothetical protein